MKTFIKNKNTISEKDNLIILVENSNNLSNLDLEKKEINYINDRLKKNDEIITINQYNREIIILRPKKMMILTFI